MNFASPKGLRTDNKVPTAHVTLSFPQELPTFETKSDDTFKLGRESSHDQPVLPLQVGKPRNSDMVFMELCKDISSISKESLPDTYQDTKMTRNTEIMPTRPVTVLDRATEKISPAKKNPDSFNFPKQLQGSLSPNKKPPVKKKKEEPHPTRQQLLDLLRAKDAVDQSLLGEIKSL